MKHYYNTSSIYCYCTEKEFTGNQTDKVSSKKEDLPTYQEWNKFASVQMSHFSIFQLEIQLPYAPLNADKQGKTKSHSSLSSRPVPPHRAMGPAIIILLPFSSTYAGEAHFRKGDGRKGFSLLSTKMHDE